MARPKLNIDPKQVVNYAELGGTNSEISRMLDCDEGTIRKRFSEELAKGRAKRRMTLRKWQWESAKKGNVTMQIWLGKNDLDQSDRSTLEHTGDGGGPVKTETTHKFDHDQFSRELEDVRRERIASAGRSVSPNGN